MLSKLALVFLISSLSLNLMANERCPEFQPRYSNCEPSLAVNGNGLSGLRVMDRGFKRWFFVAEAGGRTMENLVIADSIVRFELDDEGGVKVPAHSSAFCANDTLYVYEVLYPVGKIPMQENIKLYNSEEGLVFEMREDGKLTNRALCN